MTLLPSELVTCGRGLLDREEAVAAGAWPRVVAILARQALEGALHDFWHLVAPGMEYASTAAQLIAVRSFVPEELAGRVSWAWSTVSEACHHHAYLLAPTAVELSGWLDVAEELVQHVNERAAHFAAPRSNGPG